MKAITILAVLSVPDELASDDVATACHVAMMLESEDVHCAFVAAKRGVTAQAADAGADVVSCPKCDGVDFHACGTGDQGCSHCNACGEVIAP